MSLRGIFLAIIAATTATPARAEDFATHNRYVFAPQHFRLEQSPVPKRAAPQHNVRPGQVNVPNGMSIDNELLAQPPSQQPASAPTNSFSPAFGSPRQMTPSLSAKPAPMPSKSQTAKRPQQQPTKVASKPNGAAVRVSAKMHPKNDTPVETEVATYPAEMGFDEPIPTTAPRTAPVEELKLHGQLIKPTNK